MDELRQLGQDLARAEEWEKLLDLAQRLRADAEWWTDIWAPCLAIAARRQADPTARDFLDEAVAKGFWQPENFGGQLEDLFGADPDWMDLVAAMAANVPPPSVELTSWPSLSLVHPLTLSTIASERAHLLRDRLPAPLDSAWATATNLLHWVSTHWTHSGDSHVAPGEDSVHVLERVASGERFACVEYTIVLSQALNALGIPARSVGLFQARHHAGIGRAHQVTEAWIDELGSWVLLDGQNGMYWTLDDKEPLGSAELSRLYHAGSPPARVESLAGQRSAEQDLLWWAYFHTIKLGGCLVAGPSVSPVFQERYVMTAAQLFPSLEGLHPDLLELALGIADVDGAPALRPLTRHPHARGFKIALGGDASQLALGESWVLPRDVAGTHTATIATVTDFGPQRPHEVTFRLA